MAESELDVHDREVSLSDVMQAVKTQAKHQPFRDHQSWYNRQALYRGQTSKASAGGNQRGNQQRQGACYGCGSFQHWRKQFLSTQDLAQCRNQNKTDFIKDEHSLKNLRNNTTSVVSNIESDNLTTDYYEYEQGQANIIVKDRLKKHYLFWKSIGCCEFILDTILNGYKIPVYSTPPSICLQNNRSAIIHSEFVTEAIHDLLIRGLIEECDIQPRIVNPLTVSASNSKKKRLILDLRHVNEHLWKTSVKFEDIRIATQFITNNSFCFQFDIVSAYHHINIFNPIQNFWVLLENTSWNSCIVLSKASLIQINFWKDNLGRVNVKSLTSDFSCQSAVYSDASNTGYGGYFVETPFNIDHGMWSECESTKSSTWKERNAVKHILLSMVDILKDKRLKWFSDNQNVVSIVAKGSMKPELQEIALCIFENCLTHNISIDAECVPRTFNEKADFISHFID
ncbi:Hypothetical predicted protein [Mytilus galloprovincialis]|uniref:Reverse transcriptase domain-containing protein n=1 Tax=Mytilus galloprovincialis TaxID=29158 RepID=A0A8B6DBR0_MYTGA|nr:Hypothetical predicted protein [Mytilus galloprovincialis]